METTHTHSQIHIHTNTQAHTQSGSRKVTENVHHDGFSMKDKGSTCMSDIMDIEHKQQRWKVQSPLQPCFVKQRGFSLMGGLSSKTFNNHVIPNYI